VVEGLFFNRINPEGANKPIKGDNQFSVLVNSDLAKALFARGQEAVFGAETAFNRLFYSSEKTRTV
jgi:hypothetical protein